MIIQGKFKILSNQKIGPDYFKMAIDAAGIAQRAKPGQFIHLRCQDGTSPLLRRPFSFHRLDGKSFEILYKVIGRGTTLLAKKKKGDIIDVLGPLGNGFDLSTDQHCQLSTVLIAGGMGVAPLFAWAQSLAEAKNRNGLLVLLGARNKKDILCAKDFKNLGLEVRIATDDGSKGRKGLVTDLLRKVLPTTNDQRPTTIYACGPKAMLEKIARISQRLRIKTFASLEENMACGVGACLGCAIRTKKGFQRVCKDGPVFNLGEIKW